MDRTFTERGQIVDVHACRIFPGEVQVANGRIASVRPLSSAPSSFIMPGFVDAHVHVESSMLTPTHFARTAARFGTVGTISDPHEIANVLGADGVRYMLNDAARTPLKLRFGVPSCVPATSFETAGGRIAIGDAEELMDHPRIYGLAEMMNFPAALARDPDVLAMLDVAARRNKVRDGHFPRGRGEQVRAYAALGISTDHECVTADEARDKLRAGMKILIREGSAAKNFRALIALLDERPDDVMFCTDDLHPNDLVRGHIDSHVRRAVRGGFDRMAAIRAATKNPVEHYGVDIGLLRPGDPADFIVVDDLTDFAVLKTYVDGLLVAAKGESFLPDEPSPIANRFNCEPIRPSDIRVPAQGASARVIGVIPGELVTEPLVLPVTSRDGSAVADPETDVLKLVAVNRYKPARPAVAFVRGFGLRRGALASSIAHDSHNIVAVGSSDEEIVAAVNAVIAARGGIALSDGSATEVVELPIAGLMAASGAEDVARRYELLDRRAKDLGTTLPAPFMTLSFLMLLVIPSLKLSDLGLFDGERFQFVDTFIR